MAHDDAVAANDNTPVSDNVNKRLTNLGITDLGTVVSIVGGVAGLVYFLGGAVLTERLRLYSLPTEAVVIQIPQWTLVTLGLTEVVAPAVAYISGFALWRLVLSSALFRRSRHKNDKSRLSSPRIGLVLEVIVVAWVNYLVFALSRNTNFTGGEGLSQVSVLTDPRLSLQHYLALLLAVSLTVVFAIAAALNYVKSFSKWPDIKKMMGVVAVMTLLLWELFSCTLPLLDVKVCRKGEPPVTGWLIATSSDRLYIGQQTADPRDPRYVESVLLSGATEVFISGAAKSTPCAA